MKIPLIIRGDGTAYRLWMRTTVAEKINIIGHEIDGFVLTEVQCHPWWPIPRGWELVHEEYRKPPSEDIEHPVDRGFRQLKDLSQSMYFENRYKDKVRIDMALTAFRLMAEERDKLKAKLAGFGECRTGKHYPNDPLPDIQWDTDQAAAVLAGALDVQEGSPVQFTRGAVVKIWKALLRK